MSSDHAWAVFAVYEISEAEAEESKFGSPIPLGEDNLIGMQVGCRWCQATYESAKGQPCPEAPDAKGDVTNGEAD